MRKELRMNTSFIISFGEQRNRRQDLMLFVLFVDQSGHKHVTNRVDRRVTGQLAELAVTAVAK